MRRIASHRIASHRIASHRTTPYTFLFLFSRAKRTCCRRGRCVLCYECLATRCGGHNAHELCDPLEAATWLQSVRADLHTTLVGRRRADEHVLARYVGALTDVPAQYLYPIYVRVSANECAARLADPLLVECTCNFMRYTLKPFAALLRALLEPLTQNVADARQIKRRLHAYVHSQDLTFFGQLSSRFRRTWEQSSRRSRWPSSRRSPTNSARRSRTLRISCAAARSTRRDADAFDMAADCLSPLTAIALNAQLSGTAATMQLEEARAALAVLVRGQRSVDGRRARRGSRAQPLRARFRRVPRAQVAAELAAAHESALHAHICRALAR